ncbi:MAG TPA: (p)ppGpp synthetase, partial [Treponema sp.]|nr:(p)ppGpp synthetase [Treponema sp.]
KARIKSLPSYYKKILRQKAKESSESNELVTLTDMIGIRVICAFVEDLALVEKQVVEFFDVKEIERKGADQSFKEFGYESVHILVSIPENCLPELGISPELRKNLVCEIQVRTILQDAWAEVEHELIYKSEFNPFDKPLRRKLASINASLTLADIIFQEIRDYQKKLQNELGERRNSFYEKADEFSEEMLGQSHHQAAESSSIESPFSKGSIDDLVLTALHEHNTGNFKKAIEIYTQIINSEPVPPAMVLSVIYKHRGMAYFAQNLYEEALNDFKKSVEHDPQCFRSIYYEGIVYSVQGKEKEAIECFDRSLAIDAFQSHVYYRRALALFNLGNYTKAMEDVNNALKLGLEDDDLNTLKLKLIKKFDMNM